MRPSSREQSSSRNGDERSPRPARPRLNRETVDRAWESGAPAQHADYRTRGNNGNRGQAPRNNWNGNAQNGQNRQGGQYPARNNRPSYGDRPAGPRRFDGPANGNQRPPSRPFDANSTNRRYENSRPDAAPTPHAPQAPRTPHTNGPRPEYRDQSRPYEPRPSYRDNGQRDGFQRRNTNYSDRPNYSDHSNQSDRSERFERGPRPFDRSNRGDANQYSGRPTRSFDRDTRAPGNNYRDTRSPRNAERPETQDTRHPAGKVALSHNGIAQIVASKTAFSSRNGSRVITSVLTTLKRNHALPGILHTSMTRANLAGMRAINQNRKRKSRTSHHCLMDGY